MRTASENWAAAAGGLPETREAWLQAIAALQAEGDFDAAQAGLDQLAARHPSNRKIAVLNARLAESRGDWAAALQRWEALRQRLPDDAAVAQNLARAQARLGETGAGLATRELMLAFESLGSSCEFGLVQRHFAAEPLGLFRWVSLRGPHLIAALQTDLAGIGERAHTNLTLNKAGAFMTSDSRYRLQMHTFIRNTGQDQEALLQRLLERMLFLRRKLLEDLAAGEKIFVFRAEYRTPRERVLAIGQELRRHNGNNRLLTVIAPVAGQEDFPTGLLAPGIYATMLPTGRIMPQGSGWNIDFAAWQRVCGEALAALAS